MSDQWHLLGQLAEPLNAVGELLQAKGKTVSLVVVGGVAIILRRVRSRATTDVDVIAIASENDEQEICVLDPNPLPPTLVEVAELVRGSYGLRSDWINAVVGRQWRQGHGGMPPWLMDDIVWHIKGGLRLGIPSHRTLVALKLYAAADHQPDSVHVEDLIALRPSVNDLEAAREWILTQDCSSAFEAVLSEVIEYVTKR